MINLKDLMPLIEATNHTPALDPAEVDIKGGYVCDMLSDVMGSAKTGQAWITIMRHLNVIAVASMTGIPTVIFAKGITPDANVIDKATEESIVLLSSPFETFKLAGIVYKALSS
ncbi:MAG: hypothetical protein GX294_00225 [Candidatus Cloacimonetes bacterium]|nr:hypothetical protein [Candidatus Cloacimonadota bacterium]